MALDGVGSQLYAPAAITLGKVSHTHCRGEKLFFLLLIYNHNKGLLVSNAWHVLVLECSRWHSNTNVSWIKPAYSRQEVVPQLGRW